MYVLLRGLQGVQSDPNTTCVFVGMLQQELLPTWYGLGFAGDRRKKVRWWSFFKHSEIRELYSGKIV